MTRTTIRSEDITNTEVTNAKVADDAIGVDELSATGTAAASTFLRGDGAFAEAGGGKVLQVQSVYTDNVFSTTSSTFVDVTNVTVNITPSATSSKVLLWLNGYISNSTSSTNRCRLLRDSTDLAPGADGQGFYEANLELFSSQHTALQLCFLDSPNTCLLYTSPSPRD